jgi:hypothetical protein
MKEIDSYEDALKNADSTLSTLLDALAYHLYQVIRSSKRAYNGLAAIVYSTKWALIMMANLESEIKLNIIYQAQFVH